MNPNLCFSQWASPNYNIEAGNYDDCSYDKFKFYVPGYITSQQDNNNTIIKIDLRRGEIVSADHIQLNPGISVESNCNAPRGTLFRISPVPLCQSKILDRVNGTVAKYEKIEIGVRPDQATLDYINNFFDPNANSTAIKINPYNPDHNDLDFIDVVAHFTSPSHKNYDIYGFFYRPNFEDLHNDTWHELPTEYPFRIKFSPDEEGFWDVRITVQTAYFDAGDYILSPNCSDSYSPYTNTIFCSSNPNNLGPIVIGHHNWNVKYKEGSTTFFPLGENMEMAYPFNPKPSNYHVFKNGISELYGTGANMVRIFLSSWTMNPQSIKLTDPQFGSQVNTGRLGNFDDRQPHMGELDEVLEDMRDHEFYAILSLSHFIDFQVQNTWNNPLWDYNEFKTSNQITIPPLISGINTPLDYFQSSDCIKYTKKIYRYIISRWGYQTHIFSYQLFNEIDQINQFNSSGQVEKYTTTPSFQIAAYLFHQEMSTYIKTIDYYRHLVTTSYSGKPIMPVDNSWMLNNLDYITIHSYGQDFNYDRLSRVPEVNYYRNSSPFNNNHFIPFKPVLIDEIGSTTPCHMEDITNSNFHNSVWASMFMGSLGGAMNYWSYGIHSHNGHQDFQGMRSFISGVDFELNRFRPVEMKTVHLSNNIAGQEGHIEFFALKNYSSTRILGWLHNRTFYWGNENNSNVGFCTGCNDPCCSGCSFIQYDPQEIPYAAAPNPTWTGNAQGIGHEKITILNVPSGKRYKVDWWISTGSNLNYLYTKKFHASFLQRIHLDVPWTWGGREDFAFKIREQSASQFRLANDESTSFVENEIDEEESAIDTICFGEQVCIGDTMYKSEEDLKPLPYLYFWNFGNGETSNSPTPCFIYNSEGYYFPYCTVKDSLNNIIDSISDTIYVSSCTTYRLSRQTDSVFADKNQKIKIVPNPFINEFYIYSDLNMKAIFIYSQLGELIYLSENFNSMQFKGNFSNYTSGLYFVEILLDDGQTRFEKLIKL